MAVLDLKADFEKEVLDRSRTAPVVVDFWAAWCGPCKILGPILEKLAGEAAGRWDLVKVDTEAHPEIAGAFGITGIPTVILFHDGQPTAAFSGALPENRVRAWLDEHLPAGGGKEDPLDSARKALAAGRREEAVRLLEQASAADPTAGEPRVLLARLRFPADPAKVREILASIPDGDPFHGEAQNLVGLARLVGWARGRPGFEGPAAGKPEALARYREGAEAVAVGDYARALDAFLDVVGSDRTLDDDGARRASLAIFDLLGPEHPITQDYRRKLSSALF
jgi:putative thioredoxin